LQTAKLPKQSNRVWSHEISIGNGVWVNFRWVFCGWTELPLLCQVYVHVLTKNHWAGKYLWFPYTHTHVGGRVGGVFPPQPPTELVWSLAKMAKVDSCVCKVAKRFRKGGRAQLTGHKKLRATD